MKSGPALASFPIFGAWLVSVTRAGPVGEAAVSS